MLAAIHPDDVGALPGGARASPARILRARLLPPAFGGETRQISVKNGLEALAQQAAPQIVLIHDGARPFPSPALIGRAREAACAHGAAVPGLALTDTVKQIDARGPHRRDTAARKPAHGADAAGVPVRSHPRGASQGGCGRAKRA